MRKTQNLICIGCPLGCPLTVEMEEGNVIAVTGNTCPNGDTYAKKEMTDPRRIVTSTVAVEDGEQAVVSVKTKEAIPKNKIFDCMKELAAIKLKAPVAIGDTIITNAAETGIPIVATKNVKRTSRL